LELQIREKENRMSEEKKINLKYFRILGDSPIDNAKFFNFDAYIEAIYQIIVYPENKTPLSIVINGRWGSGKTSLMKTLQKKIKTERNPREVKTIWFNAWKYSETDAMLASLVREIYDEIDREDLFTKSGFFDKLKIWNLKIYEQANRTQQITDLAKILSLGLAPDFTKWQNTPKYEKKLPFFDAFKEYMRLILNFFVIQEKDGEYNDSKGVLVIFIDDMDRCTPESIAKILESINLFFDQQGCIFIFGMDTNLIAKAVTSHYSKYTDFKGEDYLKKMIQLQFDLPEIRKEDIKEFIENALSPDDALQNYIDLILTGSESNPRQIKQYINSLRFMMTLGGTIKRLNIEEELLVKWSILNLISGEFINKIKPNKHLFIRLQAFVRMERKAFEQWDNLEFYSTAKQEQIQKNYDELDSYLNDRIRQVLGKGKKFQEANLSDYIFLSSLAPKESDYVGTVTIVAAGDQTYYIGEKIRFIGTDTASYKVSLSITSQDVTIQNRKLDQLMVETKNNDVNTFVQVDVMGDNTWEYIWDTSKESTLLMEGIHTIYACEGPFTKDNLKNKAYGTVSIILKTPFVSATASQSSVAQGDILFITGTAEGEPKPGVQIWLFGENVFINRKIPVNLDASFMLKLEREDTKNLNPGQYFVVVQHPMLNNKFDVYLDKDGVNVLCDVPSYGTQLFSLKGPNRKNGSEAAEAIVEAINRTGIDDSYTKLQFLIEKPDIHLQIPDIIKNGEILPVNGETNLAVDDEIGLIITSAENPDQTEKSSYKPVLLSFNARVIKGESGMNKIHAEIRIVLLKAGLYLLTASARGLSAEFEKTFLLKEN
jgi:thymidylate kinase